jgi:hypothetical protein
MVGRVGTAIGAHGINIHSAAVGYHGDDDCAGGEAVKVVTTDVEVPGAVIDEIAASEGFTSGRTVTLAG